MPKQLKIDAEIHVKSKVILSSFFFGFSSLLGGKLNPNGVKIASKTMVILKIAESSKTLYFLMFFNDFHGFGRRKINQNPKKIHQKPQLEQSIDLEPFFLNFERFGSPN